MAPTALTVTDHLVLITRDLLRRHAELTPSQAYVEAVIAYRRYGVRADDLEVR